MSGGCLSWVKPSGKSSPPSGESKTLQFTCQRHDMGGQRPSEGTWVVGAPPSAPHPSPGQERWLCRAGDLNLRPRTYGKVGEDQLQLLTSTASCDIHICTCALTLVCTHSQMHTHTNQNMHTHSHIQTHTTNNMHTYT